MTGTKDEIDEPPKDGSEQRFLVSFEARAYFDSEFDDWILVRPMKGDMLPRSARYLGPVQKPPQKVGDGR